MAGVFKEVRVRLDWKLGAERGDYSGLQPSPFGPSSLRDDVLPSHVLCASVVEPKGSHQGRPFLHIQESSGKLDFFVCEGEGGIDSGAAHLHPFGAACGRPKSLRDLVDRGSYPNPPIHKNKKGTTRAPFSFLAEREGFEPSIRF
jgi:hypothetical protein